MYIARDFFPSQKRTRALADWNYELTLRCVSALQLVKPILANILFIDVVVIS